MKKNKLYSIISILVIIILFGTAAWCGPGVDLLRIIGWGPKPAIDPLGPSGTPPIPATDKEPGAAAEANGPAQEAPTKDDTKITPESKENQAMVEETPPPTMASSTSIPVNWPKNFPVNPGIKITNAQEFEKDGKYRAAIVGGYDGKPEDIRGYYKEKLSSYNLSEFNEDLADESKRITLQGSKDSTTVIVEIQYEVNGIVTVSLLYREV